MQNKHKTSSGSERVKAGHVCQILTKLSCTSRVGAPQVGFGKGSEGYQKAFPFSGLMLFAVYSPRPLSVSSLGLICSLSKKCTLRDYCASLVTFSTSVFCKYNLWTSSDAFTKFYRFAMSSDPSLVQGLPKQRPLLHLHFSFIYLFFVTAVACPWMSTVIECTLRKAGNFVSFFFLNHFIGGINPTLFFSYVLFCVRILSTHQWLTKTFFAF